MFLVMVNAVTKIKQTQRAGDALGRVGLRLGRLHRGLKEVRHQGKERLSHAGRMSKLGPFEESQGDRMDGGKQARE